MSYFYVISHEKMNLYITILDINSLYLHEEIIPNVVNQLTRTIELDGYLKHPVIADKESRVVLDGMHRVAALKALGHKRIPVCLVDYENPAISLGSWYRAIKGAGASDHIIAEVKKANLSLSEAGEIEAADIGVSPTVAAIKDCEKAFLICSSFQSLKEAYDIIKRVENRLRDFALEILYETELDALRKLREGKVDVVLLTPRLTKSSVIRTALSGSVFSFKSTRHVIPARPMCLDVSLSLLQNDEKPLDEVNDELRRMLQKRHLTHLPAGSILDGRRYEEDLYLFADSST